MKNAYIILMLCLSCPSLIARDQTKIKLYGHCNQAEHKSKERYVTIWVHGLRLFGKNKANLGLKHSSEFCRKNSITRVMRALTASFTDSFSAEHVYAFIWSAEFSKKGREQAAKDLNVVIEELDKKFHFGDPGAPKLLVIGFSEGVNVVLSLAKFKNAGVYQVDELLLLAGPVQYSTAHLVHDPLFKRISNLYSSGDYIQLIAPQQLYDIDCRNPIFTTRRFSDAPNILQAKVRTNGHAMGHFGFNSPKFVVMIAPMIEELHKLLDEKSKYECQEKHRYILTVYPCERMQLLKHRRFMPHKKPAEDACCIEL